MTERLSDEQVAEALRDARNGILLGMNSPEDVNIYRALWQVSANLSAALGRERRELHNLEVAAETIKGLQADLSSAKAERDEADRTVIGQDEQIEDLKAALSALQEKAKELEGYRDRYAAILERCRKTVGPCFCGVHISEVMAGQS
jgi:chromosome segregation ATPase